MAPTLRKPLFSAKMRLLWTASSCLFLAGCHLIPSARELHYFRPGSAGFYYCPPTLVAGHIYVGTARGYHYDVAVDNCFYKLDLNLTNVWEYPLESSEVRGGAALDSHGNIYFVVHQGRNLGRGVLQLYSLSGNGTFRWSRAIDSSPAAVGMSNPAIAADNTIYVGGSRFYAFDTNGDEKWTYGTLHDMDIMNAPVIDPEGNIYFNACGAVVSLDRNGSERWKFETSGDWFSSPAFSVDYSKLFVAVDSTVYCFQSGTGALLWRFTPEGMTGTFRATPAIDDNDNVYIGTKADKNSVFYCIRSDGSGILWKNEVGADLYSSPALGDDRTVYVGSELSGSRGHRLHALDMASGETRWSATLRADVVWSSPAISDDGTLYIASMDHGGSGGAVYAFRTESGGLLEHAGSPRFHGGNSNTGRRE